MNHILASGLCSMIALFFFLPCRKLTRLLKISTISWRYPRRLQRPNWWPPTTQNWALSFGSQGTVSSTPVPSIAFCSCPESTAKISAKRRCKGISSLLLSALLVREKKKRTGSVRWFKYSISVIARSLWETSWGTVATSVFYWKYFLLWLKCQMEIFHVLSWPGFSVEKWFANKFCFPSIQSNI